MAGLEFKAGAITCKLLRWAAFVWRFRDLKMAEFIHRHVKQGFILERPFFGYRLMLDVSRTSYHAMLYLRGVRAIDERSILSSVIQEGDRVLDVGANIGYYALMLARMTGSGGRVLCFEPEPDNLVELRRNIKINAVKKVSVIPIAVGAEAGMVGIGSGINGHVVGVEDADSMVEMRTLDDSVKERVDFIKIDVEGYEWEVLKGAQSVVSQWQPTLFIEVHPHLLPSNASIGTIIDYLLDKYNCIEYFMECQSSGWKSLLGRYSNRACIGRMNRSSKELSELMTGVRNDRFWVLCKNT